jgi:two-component system chemotaxis response regulator CheY
MAFAGIRILVVEDEQSVRRLFADMLQHWGCEVEVAMDGREAVEKYQRFRPDLVLMDLEMPLMDGFHASREIMKTDPDAYILLLSGSPDATLARKALEERFVKAVIPKPFELNELKMAIQDAIKEPKRSSLEEVRCKLSFVLFALSAKIEHRLEFSEQEIRGLRDILRGISNDLSKMD